MKIKLNESQNTEFKKLYKDEYIKWISAFQGKLASQPLFATFGNSDSGKFYIGADDDGNIVGIEKIIEESQKFNDITPQFRWENGLWVEFYFNNTPKKIDNSETRVKTRVKILELISIDPNITNQELADELELTVKGIE